MTAPKRRWFRFSLATMFVVMTLFGIWLGWQMKIVRERCETRKTFFSNGGSDFSKSEADFYTMTQPNETYEIPFWRRWLGDEAMAFISLNPHSSIEELNRIHALFPEAVVDIAIDEQGNLPVIQEIRPSDSPRR